MFAVILFGIALAGAGLTITLKKLKGTELLNMLVGWLLVVCIGLGGVWAFIGHAFFTAQVAESIGWAKSPFQFEIAVSNLSIGVLGLLCIVFKDRFRLATAVAASVYLLGCAAVHIQQAIAYDNLSVNNIGPLVWIGDIFIPVFILVLVIIADKKTAG